MGRMRVGIGVLAALAMLLADGAPLEAQGRSRHKAFRVPPGHMPAPGECRVWYQGVPPGRQPPAVPCRALQGRHFPGAVIVHTPFSERRGRRDRARVEHFVPVDFRHRDSRYRLDVVEPVRGGFLELRLVFGN